MSEMRLTTLSAREPQRTKSYLNRTYESLLEVNTIRKYNLGCFAMLLLVGRVYTLINKGSQVQN
jgi:hypothetical protein